MTQKFKVFKLYIPVVFGSRLNEVVAAVDAITADGITLGRLSTRNSIEIYTFLRFLYTIDWHKIIII